MEPEAFAELEGEVQDAMPEEQEYQTGTTVPACLVAVTEAEEGVHISVEQAVQRGGRFAVDCTAPACWHLKRYQANSSLEAVGVLFRCSWSRT
jgi:hypothetical protein